MTDKNFWIQEAERMTRPAQPAEAKETVDRLVRIYEKDDSNRRVFYVDLGEVDGIETEKIIQRIREIPCN